MNNMGMGASPSGDGYPGFGQIHPQQSVVRATSLASPTAIATSNHMVGMNASPPETGEPRVNDALGYLERVKLVFRDRPEVYTQFLEIMKNFKSQALNTEGVIERVRTLFRGHTDLILGFNQFLPPGYEIELHASDMPQRTVHVAAQVHAPAPAPAPQPTVEFNHAVNYVAKIKKRFEKSPEIYETFLQILHAYQERRNAEEAIELVKSKVQQLFHGHPDLLEEFHYFLPETADHSMRPVSMRLQQNQQHRQAIPAQLSVPSHARKTRKKRQRKGKQSDEEYPTIESEAAQSSVVFPADAKEELSVLEGIKQSLSRELYTEFLGCLSLYTNGVLTKSDLVTLLEDIFEGGPHFHRFKEVVIDYNDWDDSQSLTLEATDFYAYLANMSAVECPQASVSYKILPEEVIKPTCSGRVALCEEVLNDSLVSVPKGTEDQNYQTSRKNEYEEALFRVEDDRFELDRLIDSNRTALNALLSVQDQMCLDLAENALTILEDTLLEIHYYAIARLYGDGWYDVLELLRENPQRTVPVLIQRMEQKAVEWEGVRRQLRMPWRKVLQANYHRSLDHRSFYFKQEERKRLSARSLVDELKEAQQRFEKPKVDPSQPLDTSCLVYSGLNDQQLFGYIFDIVVQVSRDSYSAADSQQIIQLWKVFVHHFVGLDVQWEEVEGVFPGIAQTAARDTKPLQVMPETWKDQEQQDPIRRHTRPSRLFYGNYTFYVFFRLLQTLYERLDACKKLCEQKQLPFERFMNIVWDYFEQDIDEERFEDLLREKLGAQSFIAFTLDKLVAALLKPAHNICSNAVNQKLVSLYFYEYSRSTASEPSLQSSSLHARMYLANSSALVSASSPPSPDTPLSCVQLEFFCDSGELGVGLVEGSVSAGPKHTTEAWTKYLEGYLGDGDSSDVPTPFLKRNLDKRQDDKGLHLDNSLESKICLKTFRAHYVEETEDLIFRHRPHKDMSHSYPKRQKRMHTRLNIV